MGLDGFGFNEINAALRSISEEMRVMNQLKLAEFLTEDKKKEVINKIYKEYFDR